MQAEALVQPLNSTPCLYSKQLLSSRALKKKIVVKISASSSLKFVLLSTHENSFDLGCDGAKGMSDRSDVL